MFATGWWLDPQVWIVSQFAFWSLVLLNSIKHKKGRQ